MGALCSGLVPGSRTWISGGFILYRHDIKGIIHRYLRTSCGSHVSVDGIWWRKRMGLSVYVSSRISIPYNYLLAPFHGHVTSFMFWNPPLPSESESSSLQLSHPARSTSLVGHLSTQSHNPELAFLRHPLVCVENTCVHIAYRDHTPGTSPHCDAPLALRRTRRVWTPSGPWGQ